jgi:hypothetical protein
MEEIKDKQINEMEMEIWEKMPSENKIHVVHLFNQLKEKMIPRIIKREIKRTTPTKPDTSQEKK